MTTAEFLNLRKRANILTELVRLEMSTSDVDLDVVYEHASKLLEAVETLRIVDAAWQRQATAALAVQVGRA